MKKEVIGLCPVCNGRLIVKKIVCPKCGLELSNEFDLPEISYLEKQDRETLEMFLACVGSVKEMQERMGKSYPWVKKTVDDVFAKLSYKPIQENTCETDVSNLEVNLESTKTSEIVRTKLIKNGGKATVYTLQGKEYTVSITGDGKAFSTRAIPQFNYKFSVFDVITDLLKKKGGIAYKGNGRNYKLGQPGCEADTVVGAIAVGYSGHKTGDSVFDPVFILAAILEWAGICNNERGFLELKKKQDS